MDSPGDFLALVQPQQRFLLQPEVDHVVSGDGGNLEIAGFFFWSTLRKTQVERKTQVLAIFGEIQPVFFFVKLRSN